ncbi:Uncharacterised protein [Mycobacterium tuberculosis]|nr:Uncharacterised protein [Mycobacterium tuberculosis]
MSLPLNFQAWIVLKLVRQSLLSWKKSVPLSKSKNVSTVLVTQNVQVS